MTSFHDFLLSMHSAKPEKALVGLFRTIAMSDTVAMPGLAIFKSATDKVVYEMALPHGRTDITIFHVDGSATIIEAKDGRAGYTSVVQGIGQLAFYAAQLQLKGGVHHVRRALLWSFGGNADADQAIFNACVLAGVIPMNWAALDESLAALSVQPAP